MNGHPAANGLVPKGTVRSQMCSARKSNGQPCKRWAIVGGNVCPTHGGRAPQVMEAARRRLKALAPMALEVLADLAQGKATDPATGDPSNVPAAVRARAAADILSRAGVAAVTGHDVTLDYDGAPRPDLDDAIATALAARGIVPSASAGPT